MPFINSIILDGFKSFGKKTVIKFDKGINVIIGPNGSGKSNIIDAISFVFGKLGTKSLRTESMRSLVFRGSKTILSKDSATIKLVFDNSDGIFEIENERPTVVNIERNIRSDGSCIYKINDKIKTRNEVLELLNQINQVPGSFNLIHQQEIYKFTDMKAEERRKLIENLAGIGVYEIRKEKALHELAKTEEKIKEIKIILHEKQNFLENLKAEKRKAELYNKLKAEILSLKLSCNFKKKEQVLQQKNTLCNEIVKQEKRKQEKEEVKKKMLQCIENYKKEIQEIDMHIESISGIEQQELQESLTNLKTQMARLEMKKNILTNQIENSREKLKKLQEEINNTTVELKKLKEGESKEISNKEFHLLNKLDEKIVEIKKRNDYLNRRLTSIERSENELVIGKEKLNLFNRETLSISEALEKKKKLLVELKCQVAEILDENALNNAVNEIEKKKTELFQLLLEKQSIIGGFEKEKEITNTEFQEISRLTICPKCKRELDEKHRQKLAIELKQKINDINLKINGFNAEIKKINDENLKLLEQLKLLQEKAKLVSEQKKIILQIKEISKEIDELNKRKTEIGDKIRKIENAIPNLEADVNAKQLIIDELQSNKEKLDSYILEKEKLKNKLQISKNIDFDVEFKEREIETARATILRTEKERVKAEQELANILEEIKEFSKLIEEKEKKNEEIKQKFSKLLEKKSKLHEKISKAEMQISTYESEIFWFTNKMNELSVEIAKVDASAKAYDEERQELLNEIDELRTITSFAIEVENVELESEHSSELSKPYKFSEFSEFSKLDSERSQQLNESQDLHDKDEKKVEKDEEEREQREEQDETKKTLKIKIWKKIPLEKLEERLIKSKYQLSEIGSVNMMAIQAYDKVKEEVEKVNEKLKEIDNERQTIFHQIERINREKKKIFMKAYEQINNEFMYVFNSLSRKGQAKLVLENKEDPFEGGIDVVIQYGKGKHFYPTSLSGGEKILVAIAFILSIQKIFPYNFYIFDEIDASLDKYNSEKLAELLKTHIGKHQCIIVTHNDAIINKADVIYGVSMEDGVSKIISLKP